MPRFEQSDRRDVFRQFQFQISLGGQVIAACRKMSSLSVTVNTVKFRAGNSKSTVDEAMPGRVEYQPVTFEAGVTNDDTLEVWANQLVHHEFSEGRRTPEPLFRREVEILVYDIDATPVKKYVLHRAWPSKYEVSELDASGNEIIFETLELTHEGFERLDLTAG